MACLLAVATLAMELHCCGRKRYFGDFGLSTRFLGLQGSIQVMHATIHICERKFCPLASLLSRENRFVLFRSFF
jgi:hypothetical protein